MSVVGKPEIADVVFGPENGFVVVGKTDGTTNVVVLNTETGDSIFNLILQVGTGKQVSGRIYSGVSASDGYLCSKTACAPSAVNTAKPEPGTVQSPISTSSSH